MPELPEVETTLRGIKPFLAKQKVTKVIIRHPHLRWPIPKDLKRNLQGQVLETIQRRAKYLLFHFTTGTLILHLGMSGRLRVLSAPCPAKKHDHVDICFANGHYLRFTDPRRFGALLWTKDNPLLHPLLHKIGPEPLSRQFNAAYLFAQSRRKKTAIKALLMDSTIVAGVGNIYATEALFHAGLAPHQPANNITQVKCQDLVIAIKAILKKAITKGGTTLKDFTNSDGSPGYFSMELKVYGRAHQPCLRCNKPLLSIRQNQRSTVYCNHCQH